MVSFFTRILLSVAAVLFVLPGCKEKGESLKNQAPESVLKIYKKAPDFTAGNFDGQLFKSENLKGKVWIGSLFFTNCNGPCPVITSNLQVLRDEFKKYSDAAYVSISVDPANDTGAVLKDYAERHGAQTGSNWYFLNIPVDSFKTVIRDGLMLNAEGKPEMHSTHLFLVDRESNIRGYYEGIDNKRIAELSKDFKTLLDNK